MPSLRDVAEKLDVSISLVSKVLNDRLGTTGVRKDLIAKIRLTAAEMGYRKNFSALSLLAKRQNSLAVFIHSSGAHGSGLVEKVLDGISQATAARSQRINLEFFENAEHFRSKRGSLHGGLVDGLIVGGVSHPDLIEDFLEIQRVDIPVVTIYNEAIHPDLVNIGIYHEDVSEAATTHLIEQGCRNILHLSVLPQRTAGYVRALDKAGIPFRAELVETMAAPDGFLAAAGEAAVTKFLANGIAIDGISAQSDTQAAGAVTALTRKGLRVPEDVKVIGIDNAPFTKFWSVPLSSVSQRFVDRGQCAVETLNDIFEEKEVTVSYWEPRVHKRASTGF